MRWTRETDLALGGDGTLLDPGPVPSWVKVETVRAVIAVRCERCRAWEALYHVVAVRDPETLRRAVAKHEGCAA